MLDLRFARFKIMILTLIIKRGIGMRILKHDSDFELKNAPLFSVNKLFHRLWRTQILSFMPIKIYCDYTNKLTTCMFINKMSDHPLEV